MIIGIGTDIIEVERSSNILKKRLDRVFTQNERDYLARFANPSQHIAGMWAAKEAIAKALGTGFSGIAYKEIEILHQSGAPKPVLHGRARSRLNDIGGTEVFLSISHISLAAAATAVIE